jgi:hypothetical protein
MTPLLKFGIPPGSIKVCLDSIWLVEVQQTFNLNELNVIYGS